MDNEFRKPETIRVNVDDLTFVRLGTYINEFFNYNGESFTGFLVENYHENGNISYEREYQDGEQLGWEIEYHENGKIADETLMWGATPILFYEYDDEGNVLDGGITVTVDFFNECARVMGIDEIKENE